MTFNSLNHNGKIFKFQANTLLLFQNSDETGWLSKQKYLFITICAISNSFPSFTKNDLLDHIA